MLYSSANTEDAAKESIGTDFFTAQFPVFRFALLLETILRFAVFSIDISGAYLKAGEIQSDICMRPPRGRSFYL